MPGAESRSLPNVELLLVLFHRIRTELHPQCWSVTVDTESADQWSSSEAAASRVGAGGSIMHEWLIAHMANLRLQSLQRSTDTTWPKAPTLNVLLLYGVSSPHSKSHWETLVWLKIQSKQIHAYQGWHPKTLEIPCEQTKAKARSLFG